jgi:hypothetical protein
MVFACLAAGMDATLQKFLTSDSADAAAAQDAAKSLLEASTPAERCAQVRLVPVDCAIVGPAGFRLPSDL